MTIAVAVAIGLCIVVRVVFRVSWQGRTSGADSAELNAPVRALAKGRTRPELRTDVAVFAFVLALFGVRYGGVLAWIFSAPLVAVLGGTAAWWLVDRIRQRHGAGRAGL